MSVDASDDFVIPMRTKAVYFTAVSHTTLADLADKDCMVCKAPLHSPCIGCSAPASCLMTRGKCQHTFHEHCLTNWVTQHSTCPACAKSWEAEGQPFGF